MFEGQSIELLCNFSKLQTAVRQWLVSGNSFDNFWVMMKLVKLGFLDFPG